MTERLADFELLQRFVRGGEQSAFAEVVQRHLSLVFGTAWRKVADDGAAQEISQNVFCSLARKAWQFAPDDSLPAWLHKTALLEAKAWLRGELRRRRREEAAAELGTTMKTPDDQPALRALLPLLDDALLSLRETDRTALMLRYCENHSLREVGAALGVTDDTAQKRVQSALEKLSRHFQQRGYRTASVAVTAAVLKTGSAEASALVASTVVKAALQSAPPALAGLKALLARAAVLTKGQTAAMCLTVALIPLVWQLQRLHGISAAQAAWKLQMNGLQSERQKSEVEVKRLTAEATRLENRRAVMDSAASDQEEVAGKWAALKTRSQALLADEHYRWPEDLPFVRVPKSALSSLHIAGPVAVRELETKVNNFLSLSASEQDAVNTLFANYFNGIERLVADNLHPVSLTGEPSRKDGVQTVTLEPIGDKIQAAVEQFYGNLADLLGEEKWKMLNPDKSELIYYEQHRLLGYTNFAWNKRQQFSFYRRDLLGAKAIRWTTSYEGGIGQSSGDLFMEGKEKFQWPAMFQGPSIFVDYAKKYFNVDSSTAIAQ